MSRTRAARRSLRPLAVAALACVGLLLAACVPTVKPMGPQVAPPALTDTAFRAADGAELPLRRWLPEGREPRAVVLALHGFNDYSNSFDAAGRFWAGQGVATYAYDQRGFGQAANRGIWPGAQTLQADLRGAAAAVAARHPGVPLYLLGESMGGAVVLTTVAEGGLPPGVAGAVLSAPAVWARDTMPFYQRWALALGTYTIPWYEVTPPRGLRIRASDNIEMLRALGRDPLVIKRTRVDTIAGLTNLMDLALAQASRFDVPALVLYGENEELIPPVPVARALNALPKPAALDRGPRVALYKDGWHLLLRDLKAEVVWRDVLAWIGDPAAPLPSGADRHPQALAALKGAAEPLERKARETAEQVAPPKAPLNATAPATPPAAGAPAAP